MKRRLYAPTVLFIGLLSTQLIAAVHVRLSNLALLEATETMMRSGYLAVPNARVAANLDSWTTAMAGGLFFTLSVGAGLSLVTLIAAWLWDRALGRRRKATAFLLLIWIAGLLLVNGNGWNPAATTYLVVVPLLTAWAAIRMLPARTPLLSSRGIVWPVAAAIILMLLWGLVLDRDLFTNIRDHLLLDNRVGRSITNAYYTYTLFPAEAFKALDQKQIRTCVLDNTLGRATRRRLDQILRSHDYLPIANGHIADLTIGRVPGDASFRLATSHRTVMDASEQALFGRPAELLASYSHNRDRNRMFRAFCMAGLLLGFPLILYTLFFSLIGALPNLFLTVTVSDVIAAILCVVVGTVLLVPVYQGHAAKPPPADVVMALSATSAITRIAALRQAYKARRDIAHDAKHHGLEKSPHIAERYWLARSLAYAKGPQAHTMLSVLVNDAVPIVACQALWAMGASHNLKAIPTIIGRIKATPHWYIQMYGYRALRTLGWVQPRSRLLSY